MSCGEVDKLHVPQQSLFDATKSCIDRMDPSKSLRQIFRYCLLLFVMQLPRKTTGGHGGLRALQITLVHLHRDLRNPTYQMGQARMHFCPQEMHPTYQMGQARMHFLRTEMVL